MKQKLTKYIIILFSVVFAIRVLTIFAADRLYSMSLAAEKGIISPNKAITYLDYAISLDSTNADLYYQKYKILRGLSPKGTVLDEDRNLHKKQLHTLRKCINLCPTLSRYHIFYAFTLKRMMPKSNPMTRQMILSEMKKAVQLKSYSKLYGKIYRTHQ